MTSHPVPLQMGYLAWPEQIATECGVLRGNGIIPDGGDALECL